MFYEQADNLGDAMRTQNAPTLAANVTVNTKTTVINANLESAPNGAWVKHYFPKRFTRPFTFYQNDFWNWGNSIVRDERPRPRIECEPRGVGKSSSARGLVVKLLAEKKKYYVLYVSATDEQAQKHFNAIRSMLESDQLLTDYPHLSPQSQKHRPNVNKNWSSERLVTAENQVVEFISLLGNARGFTTEEGQRPDLIVLDDIDDSKDSPHMVNKKLDILKYSVLPAKAENTLVLFPQNLIHRDSVCQQIKDQRADILSDRIFVGAYPLMKWYEAEKVDLHDGTGAMRWKITAGEVFDEAIPISYCEELLNEIGKDAFDRECHPLGTRIRTLRGLLGIEHVEVGDWVTTHLGRLRKVTELIRRDYTGDLVSIRRGGKSEWLQATASHPLYVARRPEHNIWYATKGQKNFAALVYEWASADSLRKDDFLLEPLPIEPEYPTDGKTLWTFQGQAIGRPAKGNKEIKITPALLRLIGYYLAEGGVHGRNVTLTFHEDEVEYYEDVERLFREVFDVGVYARLSNGRSVEISVSSAIPREFFKQIIGTGSKNKSIPLFVDGISKDLVRELLIGYFRGDGCKDPSGFAYNTTSEQLAEGIRLLLLRMGVVGSVYKLRPRIVSLPQGKYERSEHWQGDINGGFANKLADILGESHSGIGDRNSAFIHNGYVHYCVRALKFDYVENLPVYNFEVDEDHSFIAEGVCSHNCQQDVFKVADDKDFREWDEVYHVITYSEFREFFESNGVNVWNDKTDRPLIPHNWNCADGLDWGTTVGHPAVCASFARPNQSTPLNNCFFAYAETVLPKYPLPSHEETPLVSPGRVAAAIKETKSRWNVQEGQTRIRLMSHEASAALATMAIDLEDRLKEFYAKWKPKKGSGVPQMQNLLEIDRTKPHPFRKHPKTREPIMGCPRIFFLVPDEQGRLLLDSLGNLFVAQPKDSLGFARARFEIPIYSHLNSGQHKIDDDYVDAACGVLNIFGVSSQPLTETEMVESAMPEPLKQHNLVPEGQSFIPAGRQAARWEAEERIKKELDLVPDEAWEFEGY